MLLEGEKNTNSTVIGLYSNIVTVPANKFHFILCGTWEEIELVTKTQYSYNNQDLKEEGKWGTQEMKNELATLNRVLIIQQAGHQLQSKIWLWKAKLPPLKIKLVHGLSC